MPLGTEVGLGPGNTVLDGDPVPLFGEDPNFGGVNGLTDRHELKFGTVTILTVLTFLPLTFRNFKNPRWRRPPF